MDAEAATVRQPAFDTAPLSSLVQDAAYRLPGCDALTIRKELQASMRRFCEHTGAMVERVFAPVGFGCQARAVPSYRATILRAEAHDGYGREWHAWTEGGACAVCRTMPGMAGSRVQFTLHLVPERDTEDVPPGFIERWGDAILHGALANLFSMRNRPWADVDSANRENAEWNTALADAALPETPPTAMPRRNGMW